MALISDDTLEQMSKLGDPPADTLVSELIQRGRAEEAHANHLFDLLASNRDPVPANLPPAARAYFESTAQLPAWADPELIRQGQDFFQLYGQQITLLLFCRALPLLYACPRGAETLVRTGRLQEARGKRDRFGALNHRILETAQFLLDVMDDGGLGPDGRGIRSTQKVRLIHAAIRRFLTDAGWDATDLGAPINQKFLAGVLYSFSVAMLDGLKLIGVMPSAAEERAYLHSWSVVGHILGVHDELNLRDPAAARELFARILEQETGESDAGRELTRSLIDYMNSRLPLGFFNAFPGFMMQLQIGKRKARLIGVTEKAPWWMRAMYRVMRFFLRVRDAADNRSWLLRKISEEFSKRLLRALVFVYNDGKKIQFDMPPSLRGSWGLDGSR